MGEFVSHCQLLAASPISQDWACIRIAAEHAQGWREAQWESWFLESELMEAERDAAEALLQFSLLIVGGLEETFTVVHPYL